MRVRVRVGVRLRVRLEGEGEFKGEGGGEFKDRVNVHGNITVTMIMQPLFIRYSYWFCLAQKRKFSHGNCVLLRTKAIVFKWA